MKTDTSEKIIEIIRKNGQSRVHDICLELEISPQAIHRQLKKLLNEGKLEKLGKPPRVFYKLAQAKRKQKVELSPAVETYLNENFQYVHPNGRIIGGLDGFQFWVQTRNLEKQLVPLASEFRETAEQAKKLFKGKDWLNGTDKVQNTFAQLWLDKVYFSEFYSIPKFGKTKMGQLVSLGKSSQSLSAIKQLATIIKPTIEKIIKSEKIDAIAWAPHSIPRKLSFLNELRRLLHLVLPEIALEKVYSGDSPIAQKTLSKLSERIINARETIVINNKQSFAKRVLIIDDAVGSGATLNEIASKLKSQLKVKHVVGYAIVGSYKGFDVVAEV